MLRRLWRQLVAAKGAAPAQAPAAALGQAMDCMRRHDYAAAEALCRDIVGRDPAAADAWELLGAIALAQGDADGACERFDAALRLTGDRLQTLCNAAEANRQAGRHARALELAGRALAQEPENGAAMHVRALALQSCWRADEALELYRRLVEAHPDQAMPYTSYLLLLVLLGRDAQEVLAAHRRWAEVHAEPLSAAAVSHGNPPDPLRRLRVGYVSADFREHAANRFIEPILASHDPAQFELYCYANIENTDAVTGRFRSLVSNWRDIRWETDAAAAELVRADAIDILVDLSGHTGGNRLGIFARRPAPVQITYLGYAATTGMSAMDWRLTDAVADPAGSAEPNYTERLLRLPNSLWCFGPDAAMPEPGPLPASRSGRITFGSPNSVFKLTPRMIALWSRLLLSVPGSRLLLATVPEGEARERIVAGFAAHGVPAGALSLHAPLSRERFWSLYAQIDIALDTFPCNGGATTCETLWSGVPVVSLAGSLFQSRAGLSLLSAIGMPELVAHSEEQFLRIARELATDQARLARLRGGLRQRMLASPLLDAARFTRGLEALYRWAWREWCGRGRHA